MDRSELYFHVMPWRVLIEEGEVPVAGSLSCPRVFSEEGSALAVPCSDHCAPLAHVGTACPVPALVRALLVSLLPSLAFLH